MGGTWHRSNWIGLVVEILRVLLAAVAGFTGAEVSLSNDAQQNVSRLESSSVPSRFGNEGAEHQRSTDAWWLEALAVSQS